MADSRENTKLIMMYKIINNLVPHTLQSVIPNIFNPEMPNYVGYNTCQRDDISHFRARTYLFNNSFFPSTTRLWNELLLYIRNSQTLSIF